MQSMSDIDESVSEDMKRIKKHQDKMKMQTENRQLECHRKKERKKKKVGYLEKKKIGKVLLKIKYDKKQTYLQRQNKG